MINLGLLTKRTPNDISISLNVAEHKFKRAAEKFNWVIDDIYGKTKESGTKMFHLIMSLQIYFDMEWLTVNVLNDTNKRIISEEMRIEYDKAVKKKKTKKKV